MSKIRSLKAKTNLYEVWETGRSGFGLRASASSNKSWFFLIALMVYRIM